MPTIRYRGDGIDETVTESAIVAQFLAEAHPSHLLPTSGTPAAAGLRARINFFVDTFFGKVNPGMFKIISENDKAAMETKSEELVKLMEKEIEPLLKDANPFFGGSKDLTLAEVSIQFPQYLAIIGVLTGLLRSKQFPLFCDTTTSATTSSFQRHWQKDSISCQTSRTGPRPRDPIPALRLPGRMRRRDDSRCKGGCISTRHLNESLSWIGRRTGEESKTLSPVNVDASVRDIEMKHDDLRIRTSVLEDRSGVYCTVYHNHKQ